MTEETMQRLFSFNNKVPMESLCPNPRKRQADSSSRARWAGYCVRAMLHFLYIISMLCLLRYDEALNIRWDDITTGRDEHGVYFLRLNLPFRKTHQNGSEWH